MTMKMITCCPACSTLFRVEPDQLRVAGGWVRCGQCMVAFDARARMMPADPYVPPDLDWQEKSNAQNGAPRFGLAERADDTEPRPAVAPAAGMTGADTAAMAPASQGNAGPSQVSLSPSGGGLGAAQPWGRSEIRPESPAAEIPAFAAPPFELVPPPSPAEPAPVPEFIGGSLPSTAAPQAFATNQTHDQAAPPTPPLPIPTNDELDRRYARLLETLARLRETAEQQDADSLRRNEGTDPATQDGRWDSLGRPQPDASRSDADRAVRRRDISADPGITYERKRAGRQYDQGRRAENDAQFWRGQEPDEELLSRPMIDFVLSEMSPSLATLTTSTPSRLEPESETRRTEPAVPSFVEQARRRAFWGLPQVRAGLWVAAGVLAMALAAQIAVSQRNRLAAQHPGAAPLLQALCRPLQCRIAPWQHLSAVTIDSSSFVRTGPDGFRFAITLRNSGAAPVATPALELALIDAQDQPLARRVLTPADWGAPLQLAAHVEFNGAAWLRVLDAAHPQAVSNYRLTAFYP